MEIQRDGSTKIYGAESYRFVAQYLLGAGLEQLKKLLKL
jgi:hypothetical protein